MKAEVDDLKPDFDTVNKQAQALISAGLGFDSAMVKQMSDTDKQWNNVNDAAVNQQAELEKALHQVEEIQEALSQADQAMDETEEKVKQLPPIGADVDTINQQLDDIKVSKTRQPHLRNFSFNIKRAKLSIEKKKRFAGHHINALLDVDIQWLPSKTKILEPPYTWETVPHKDRTRVSFTSIKFYTVGERVNCSSIQPFVQLPLASLCW